MTRAELRAKFRAENPEVTVRVISDTTLNEWMKTANKEVCCETRCIVTNESEIIESIVGRKYYDLESEISNFHDIDDMPGGGVYYDDKPLLKASPGEMNRLSRSWRTASNGTPKRYWRRGKYLRLDRGPDTANVDIAVDCILRPEDFDADSKEPFNGLQHLQDFSDSINKYLQWRTKDLIGKEGESDKAFKNYLTYIAWMKKRVKGSKYGAIYIQPK